jgi:hypothetical protein
MSDPRMLKLATLWERTSAKTGKTYFSGFMGDVQLLLFDGGMKPHPTRPDEEVHTWNLLAQERDPSRRPGAAHECEGRPPAPEGRDPPSPRSGQPRTAGEGILRAFGRGRPFDDDVSDI